MIKKLFLACIVCLITTVAGATERPYYYQAKAKNGDGVYSLFKRYQLDFNECNRAQFFILNQLPPDAVLKKDARYKLPVLIYQYDSKSIRSTLGIADYDKALRIKEYNDVILSSKMRKYNYIDSKILWVPYHELFCSNIKEIEKEKADKPLSNGEYVLEPLFGPELSRVKVTSKSLKNKVYYIVSGHGGPDPGARCTSCPNTLCEDEYAYDVSLRLAKSLLEKGAIVHIIIKDENDGIRDDRHLKCDTDEVSGNYIKIPLNQKMRLNQRASHINNLYKQYKRRGIEDQFAIMVHIDSNSKDKKQDVFFYYFEGSQTSKKLANSLQDKFEEKYNYHQKSRGYKGYVKERNLHMLRNTLPTAVFIELANIRNMADQKRIVLPSNRQALANWLAEGLEEFK